MKLLCLELRRCDRPEPTRMSPLLEVTEDTPPDMLTGSMDLRLVLPDGKRVRMSVDRRTPMMDLLVQATTAYKISPAGNVLQPYGESGVLPYKPSTPIGALDTWIVHIVPKNQALQNPSNKINLKQVIPPFEQTHRFQVNLPRNQLYVTRVSGRCSMRDILLQACNEKNLDPSRYTLRHPKHLDKPLCDEMSIAEYGHNQVTMLSIQNLPTAVSTEDILMMNKYKAHSDSGSGSAASSSVSPVPPAQIAKPSRKRKPAPKPPALLQKQQQSETIICHSRTSSDSSGYHEASVLSESPDSNNSLPDSLPRRSKLPAAEPKVKTVDNKLSRSLSNLHQASTSAASSSGLKPAQSTSCLVQARKKKPAPPPPAAIAEEKEEKSATLPPGARLLENSSVVTDSPHINGIGHRTPSPANEHVMVANRSNRPRAPLPRPRPRSTAFEINRPTTDVFSKLEGIFEKMAPECPPAKDSESESARLEAEIERMFEQATREHVSLESGVELSRGPSPDWNWEYRLPAPPTFRDDVTTPSLADLNITSNTSSKHILFEPLENTEEAIKEESAVKIKALINEKTNETSIVKQNDDSVRTNKFESVNESIQINPIESIFKNPQTCTDGITINGLSDDINLVNGHSESNADNSKLTNKTKKAEKVYIMAENVSNVNSHREVLKTTPKTTETINSINNILKQNITLKNQRNTQIIDEMPKITEIKSEKISINIKTEEPQEITRIIGRAKVERSDTVIRVNGRQERKQEQTAILNELTTAITERQTKPRETKPPESVERPQTAPLKNFSITTYSGSKPVEIYKEKPVLKDRKNEPEVKVNNEVKREVSGIMRSNSSAEEKKGPTPVKRSASVVTNLQRKLDLSRSNGNLLEVDEFPLKNFRSTLRKTTSELSINIDAEDQKEILAKPEQPGLQSLQVLRSILPQLSQSQGALNTLGQINDKKEEKPAVCLTTWGERPKRQVSIKTDRDYVTSGGKLESQASVTVEVVSPLKPSPPPLLAADRAITVDRKPRTSVYKSMETGNTKAIRLPPSDLGRLPIVRAVELKKQPDSAIRPPELRPEENGFLNGTVDKNFSFDKPFASEKPFGPFKSSRPENRQIRPPSYLFGCEPKVPPPPPAPQAPLLVKLKPVSLRGELKKQPLADPRDELLASIRNFGKNTLRKVSTR